MGPFSAKLPVVALAHGSRFEEAQSLAAMRAYNVRYASIDAQEAASNTRELIASGFPQVSGSVEYNRYIDIPTQVSSGDAFGFPDYLTAFLGGVAQATGVPLDAPPVDPNAIQEFQFGAAQTMTAGITATQLIFSPSYFVGIQAAKAYASAMEASESKSVADARRARWGRLCSCFGCSRKCGHSQSRRSPCRGGIGPDTCPRC